MTSLYINVYYIARAIVKKKSQRVKSFINSYRDIGQ